MLLIAALFAASPHPQIAGHPATSIKPLCRNPEIHHAAGVAKPGLHPLGAEPPAREIKAVVREIDGCNKPIVVAERVGVKQRQPLRIKASALRRRPEPWPYAEWGHQRSGLRRITISA